MQKHSYHSRIGHCRPVMLHRHTELEVTIGELEGPDDPLNLAPASGLTRPMLPVYARRGSRPRDRQSLLRGDL